MHPVTRATRPNSLLKYSRQNPHLGHRERFVYGKNWFIEKLLNLFLPQSGTSVFNNGKRNTWGAEDEATECVLVTWKATIFEKIKGIFSTDIQL